MQGIQQQAVRQILLVEDDGDLTEALRTILLREGYRVVMASSAEKANRLLAESSFDVVLLDIGLPGMDGFAWLRQLRESRLDTPVVILSGRAEVADRVRGLELGADDYLTKPFAPTELVARLGAMQSRERALRRDHVVHGPLRVDFTGRRATLDGHRLVLSAREQSILEFLFRHVDAVVSKESIASYVGAIGEGLSPVAVEVHVSRLRSKLAPHGIRVRAIRRLGYLVEKWQAAEK